MEDLSVSQATLMVALSGGIGNRPKDTILPV
jgi:hypothetical protein